MFILRRITSEGNENNSCLGQDYNFVHNVHHSQEFLRALEASRYDSDEIYAFIFYDAGERIIPLYKKSTYYMMTDTGNTFANLTNRF